MRWLPMATHLAEADFPDLVKLNDPAFLVWEAHKVYLSIITIQLLPYQGSHTTEHADVALWEKVKPLFKIKFISNE